MPVDAPSSRPSTRFRGSERWRRLSAALRAARPRCEICGTTEALSVDHIEPVSAGGAVFDQENLRVVCASCNTRAARSLRVGGAGGSSK